MKSKKKGDANKMPKAGANNKRRANPGVPRVVVSSERVKPAEPGKKRLRRIVIALGVVVIFAMVCVVMNESNDYLRTLIEETRLRPHMERIFGKDVKFGIEFKLC